MNDESYWTGHASACRRFATEGLTLLELRQLLREAEQHARREVTRLRAERLGRETIARGETVVEAHHQMPTWEAGPTRAEVEAWQRGGVECEPAWAWRPERPALGLHHGVELLGETDDNGGSVAHPDPRAAGGEGSGVAGEAVGSGGVECGTCAGGGLIFDERRMAVDCGACHGLGLLW